MNDGLRILMLEDNPADAHLNEERLIDEGYSPACRRVETEAQFVAELERFRPDIILADYRLPRFDGMDALRLAHERYPFIPFIIVSGVLEEEAAAALLRSGAADYILKGKLTRLGSAVKNALRMKAAQEEKARAEDELRKTNQELELRVEERTRELTRARDAAEDARRRLFALLEYLPEGIIFADKPDMRITVLSKYNEIVTGKPIQDLQAANMNDILSAWEPYHLDGKTPKQAEELPLSRAMRGEVIRDEESMLKTANGQMIAIATTAGPIYDASGKVTGAVLAWRDITERKKAEETLRRNEYELRTLIDNSPDLIFRLNREMRYLFVNPAFEGITGITKEQFTGRTNSELGMPEEQIQLWETAVKTVIETGRETNVEYSLNSLFGERHFGGRVIPEFAKSGMVETVLVISRDITERKKAEEHIRYISFHDRVTGLFNRAWFEEEAARLDTERMLPVSIIMGDLNNLKMINEVFGHDEGDALLKRMAEILKVCCRDEDIIARWGGDEFSIILPATDRHTAEAICDRIHNATNQGRTLTNRPSIALGTATKENMAQNTHRVIRTARQRMYDNKLAGSRENKEFVLSSLFSRLTDSIPELRIQIDRMHILGRKFGRELNFSREKMEDLALLTEFHDIGLVAVPKSILSKPDSLTQEEWSVLKKHAEIGYRIVTSFADTARISDEVLSHAERWDGSGYPRGLKETEIPYLDRVFAIIHAFDTMTHETALQPGLFTRRSGGTAPAGCGRPFRPGTGGDIHQNHDRRTQRLMGTGCTEMRR